MKTCHECGAEYPPTRVICTRCGEILEEHHYLRLIWITVAIAGAFHAYLGRLGYRGRGLFSETFQTALFLLLIFLIVWKLIQKIREPQRRVLYELASLYSDRTGRLAIIGGIIALSIIEFAPASSPPAAAIAEPAKLADFRFVRVVFILPLAAAYLVLTLACQGTAFFNFRLRNSLEPRERATAGPEELLPQVEFTPKWKELLIGRMDGHRFTIEMTMGVAKVFLPSEKTWNATAPDWARNQWPRVHSDLKLWCRQQSIPLVVEDTAWVEFSSEPAA